MGGRVDELTDGYIRHLEERNDMLTARYNVDVEIYNLLHEFIERQYVKECEDFYEDYNVLMGALEAVDPSLVAPREVKSEGPPTLRVVPSEPRDA